MKRNTYQKAMIYEALGTLCHPTADDIYSHILIKYPHISKGTVYRNLSQMVKEGQITQVSMPHGPDHYDRTLYNHYHGKCKSCGGVFDVDVPYQDGLNLVSGADGCVIHTHTLLFSGLCAKCNNKQQMEDKK